MDYNIGTDTTGKDNPVDEVIVAEITKDKMLGVISFREPRNNGKVLTIDQVSQKIREIGIVSGLSQETVEAIVREKKYNHKYIIAKGTPPVHGQDGKLEFFFNTQACACESFKPKYNEDGSVDFKQLDLILTVSKDQLLVQIIPPVVGVPGKNVLGQEIRFTPGKIVRLPKGKNTYVSPDGNQLFSAIEGQLIYANKMITVNETYVVSGNAGIATGDIDFSGNVVIKGNAESGFQIKAGGNVEVQGFVEEATIIAGGNIILRYGIQGKDKGKLVAGKDVVAKFIQNSIVEAEGCVYTEAIMHSRVVAGDSIIVEANKGLIVGGSVQATNLISAKVIGSPMSTVTKVQLSINLSLHNKYRSIEAELNNKKRQLDQVEKNISFIHAKLAKGVQLPKNKMDQTKKMLELQQQLIKETAEISKEYESLQVTINNYKEGAIKVRDIMYPGCKIIMGSLLKYVKEELKYCNIIVEDREITIGTYL